MMGTGLIVDCLQNLCMAFIIIYSMIHARPKEKFGPVHETSVKQKYSRLFIPFPDISNVQRSNRIWGFNHIACYQIDQNFEPCSSLVGCNWNQFARVRFFVHKGTRKSWSLLKSELLCNWILGVTYIYESSSLLDIDGHTKFLVKVLNNALWTHTHTHM